MGIELTNRGSVEHVYMNYKLWESNMSIANMDIQQAILKLALSVILGTVNRINAVYTYKSYWSTKVDEGSRENKYKIK